MRDAPTPPRRGRRPPTAAPPADRDERLERAIRAEELAFGKVERPIEEPLPVSG